MKIDHKVMFQELMEQVNLELAWTEEELDKETDANKIQFYNGMKRAYNSIKEMAEILEKEVITFWD